MRKSLTAPWRVRYPRTAERNFEELERITPHIPINIMFHGLDLLALHYEKYKEEEPFWQTAKAVQMLWFAGYLKGKRDERERRKAHGKETKN